VQGLLIIADLKEQSEGDRRLFRKKRLQLEKKIGLKRLKNGVYLFPIMNPRKPTEDELIAFEKVEDLINEFATTAIYFVATQVKPENLVTEDPLEGGKIDMRKVKCYFILRPIRKLRE
jgi:predicted transcriptional regulator of viral defense system